MHDHREELSIGRVEHLTEVTRSIRHALVRDGITGANGAQIDSVALFGPPQRHDARSRDFVLRFGKAYGRSPCGTGMSAKLACLFEDGIVAEGENWRQESIVGTVLDGSVEVVDGVIRPTARHRIRHGRSDANHRRALCWGIN